MSKSENPQSRYIPVGQITPDPNQPRKELGDLKALENSFVDVGQATAITVIALGHDQYQIVDGERRWEAAKQCGQESLLCQIMDIPSRQIRDMQFNANFHRKELNPFEYVAELARIKKEKSLSDKGLADLCGKSRSEITSMLHLNSLPRDIREKLTGNSKLIAKEALYLITREKSTEEMEKIARMAMEGKTIKDIRGVRRERNTSNPSKKQKAAQDDMDGMRADEMPSASPKAATIAAREGGRCQMEPSRLNDDPTVEGIAMAEDIEPVKEEQALAAEDQDSRIVRLWWKNYSTYAVKACELNKLGLPLSGKELRDWLQMQNGETISGYRIVIRWTCNTNICQLIPVNLTRDVPWQSGL